MHFEMDGLMQVKPLVLPVLTYLFHRLEARFDGRPTLLVLDEAWVFLDDPLFAARIREWLKTLRKKNVAVVFATQSLADIERSSIAPAIIESCPTRIFLPNDRAIEPQAAAVYERFGLNAAPDRDHRPRHAEARLLRADGPRQPAVRARPRADRAGVRRRGLTRRPAPDRQVRRRGGAGRLRHRVPARQGSRVGGGAAGEHAAHAHPRHQSSHRRFRQALAPQRARHQARRRAAQQHCGQRRAGGATAASAVSERLSPFRIPPAKPKRTTS